MKIQEQLLKSLNNTQKKDVVGEIEDISIQNGYHIKEENIDKPWGAYLKLDESNIKQFMNDFFPNHGLNISNSTKIEFSPKFLIVEAKQRLSWQYHNRRHEHWSFITDGYYHRSENNDIGEKISAKPSECVSLKNQERHRLVGRDDGWCLVAEIWEHTDLDNLSDENDIVRLQDDYKR